MYVWPKLEYASPIQSPHRSNNINHNEAIQSRIARFISPSYLQSYCFSPEKLPWPCSVNDLSYHLLLMQPSQVLLPSPICLHYASRPTTQDLLTTKPFTNYKVHVCKNSHLQLFFPNTIKVWNNLPDRLALIIDARILQLHYFFSCFDCVEMSSVIDFNYVPLM